MPTPSNQISLPIKSEPNKGIPLFNVPFFNVLGKSKDANMLIRTN